MSVRRSRLKSFGLDIVELHARIPFLYQKITNSNTHFSYIFSSKKSNLDPPWDGSIDTQELKANEVCMREQQVLILLKNKNKLNSQFRKVHKNQSDKVIFIMNWFPKALLHSINTEISRILQKAKFLFRAGKLFRSLWKFITQEQWNRSFQAVATWVDWKF